MHSPGDETANDIPRFRFYGSVIVSFNLRSRSETPASMMKLLPESVVQSFLSGLQYAKALAGKLISTFLVSPALSVTLLKPFSSRNGRGTAAPDSPA